MIGGEYERVVILTDYDVVGKAYAECCLLLYLPRVD